MSTKSKLGKVWRVLVNINLYRYFFYNLITIRKLVKPPVILCGCPRSGTSLLVSILDSHPEIYAIPFETTVLQHRRERLFKSKKIHFLFTRIQLGVYLISNRIKPTATMWCEKTPFNIFNIVEILEMFDNNIKIINIIRDGRDVVASYHPRLGYLVRPITWKKCIVEGNKFRSRSNFLTIRYEDLLENAPLELGRIKTFLQLGCDFNTDDWLTKTNVKGYIKSPVNNDMGVSVISSDINKKSVGNWRKSESPFVAQFLSNKDCVELNRSLGYHD